MTIGESAEQPVFMKLIRDDEGVKWGNVIVMLGLTVLSGYLASKSQRIGSDIDFTTQLKMKLATTEQKLGRKLSKLGDALYDAGCAHYDSVRSV